MPDTDTGPSVYPRWAVPRPTTDLVLARSEINDVLASYCQAVDRRDWQSVLECYHDDAVDQHGEFHGSPADLVEWMKAKHEHVTSCMHVLSNVWIRLESPRLARAESYCLSYKAVTNGKHDPFVGESGANGPVRRTVACRYVDVFERRDTAGWRIKNRRVVIEWVRVEPPEMFLPVGPDLLVSRRDPQDALYAPLDDSGT